MNHSITTNASVTNASRSTASRAIERLRRSRSLASMLPSLLFTGALTLIMTAVMQLVWEGLTADFFSVWMTTWLTAWPIAFPVAYLIGPATSRFAARITAPARTRKPQVRQPVGLWFDDIADASARATAKNGLRANHRLRDPFH
ncbi:MAG TPA: DUF2798 domain-containing protein [Noviherbaspirillum sp.]|jgi:hypothetical protein|uniref:DUF2798 domain-containing protein n=1 Tax=Noviherbaspirillum sp. TaxID=1926288 RepID=UPI002DDC945B|nr:DUF2798 domain-containing protein [Noviherbaspirillum sp.]HEV2610444.1 DUF2798 domain-containing protein [Noviherbaspirillum sp.]